MFVLVSVVTIRYAFHFLAVKTTAPAMKTAPDSSGLGGIGLGLAGIFLLCSMDAVVKALGAHLPTFQIVFLRYFGAALWLMLWIALSRGAWPQRRNLSRYLLRGALLGTTAFLFFYAVSHLPLAIAAALAMTAPVYMTGLGMLTLREPVRVHPILALLLGGAGSAIIVLGGSAAGQAGTVNVLAWGAAILAPVSYALTMVILKNHSSHEDAAAMTLAQSLAAAAFMLPLALKEFVIPRGAVTTQMVLVGLFGASGFLMLTSGLKRIPVSIFAALDYTALLWAALFGWLFFTEVPAPSFYAGAALIIAACLVSARTAQS